MEIGVYVNAAIGITNRFIVNVKSKGDKKMELSGIFEFCEFNTVSFDLRGNFNSIKEAMADRRSHSSDDPYANGSREELLFTVSKEVAELANQWIREVYMLANENGLFTKITFEKAFDPNEGKRNKMFSTGVLIKIKLYDAFATCEKINASPLCNTTVTTAFVKVDGKVNKTDFYKTNK